MSCGCGSGSLCGKAMSRGRTKDRGARRCRRLGHVVVVTLGDHARLAEEESFDAV